MKLGNSFRNLKRILAKHSTLFSYTSLDPVKRGNVYDEHM